MDDVDLVASDVVGQPPLRGESLDVVEPFDRVLGERDGARLDGRHEAVDALEARQPDREAGGVEGVDEVHDLPLGPPLDDDGKKLQQVHGRHGYRAPAGAGAGAAASWMAFTATASPAM